MTDYAAYYPGVGAEKSQDEAPTWGDYAKTVGASVTGAGAQLAAGARAATQDSPTDEGQVVHQLSTALQGYLNHTTDDLEGDRTESAKKRAAAAITSKDFWDHPVSAGALQLAGMSGPAAAMIFSGGPIGAAVVNGSLSAGAYLNDVDKLIDGMSAGDLEQNKYYSTLRSLGMDESEARDGLKQKLIAGKTMVNFLAGAAAGAIGPAGKVAAGVGGKAAAGLAGAETGVAGRAALGAAEGAGGAGLQGGVNDAALQNTQIDAGQKKEFDQEALVNAVLTPAAIGGVAGAAAGAAVKPKGKAKAAPADTPIPETPTDGVPKTQVTTEQGSGPNGPPLQAETAGATQATPDSGSPAQVPGAKGQAVKAKANNKKPQTTDTKVAVVDVAGPTPEQALALKPADVAPPEVAAASQRVQEAAPKAPEPASQAAPEVPPEVAAASQRVAEPAPQPEAQPVTPEVTPAPEPAPVSSVAPPTTPEVAAPKKGRVLRDLRSVDETAPIAPLVEAKVDDEGNKVVPGRKMSQKLRDKVAAHGAKSEEIVNAHPATEAETNYIGDKGAKAAVVKRAQDMVAAADKAEHKIPAKISESVNKDQITDHPATQMLVYARDLARAAKSKSGVKLDSAIQRFKEREEGVKSGNAADEVSKRKSEGDAAMRRDQGEAGDRGATTETPESILAAKEGAAEETSTADAQDEAKARAAAGSIDTEKNAVETNVAQSSKGAVRGVDDATEKRKVKTKDGKEQEVEGTKAASAGKTTSGKTIGDDMKAKYAAMLEAAQKKKSQPDLVDNLAAEPRKITDKFTKNELKPLKSTTAKEVLKSLDLAHLSGVPRALAEFAKKRLQDAVGDRPVHILNKYDMARATGDVKTAFADETQGITGEHNLYRDGSGGHILLRHDALLTPQQTAHTALHEILHAETSRALFENPVIHKRVSRMMAETHEALKSFPADIRGKMDYAMSNPREFIAEAHSNPVVQEILTHIRMSDALAKELRLDAQRKPTMWDGMIAQVREIIEGLTGRLPDGHRMIEGVLRAGENIEYHNRQIKAREVELGGHAELNLHGLGDPELKDRLNFQEAGDHAADMLTNATGMIRRGGRRLLTKHMIADGAEKYVGEGVKKLIDADAQKDREKDNILNSHGGAEVVRRTAELERSNPEDMAKGADLLFDASLHDVNLGPNADNSHLGVDATKGWQAKKLLPELQARFNKLAPEVQEHLQKSVKFFRDIHNEVSRAVINNVLEVAGIHDPALAERIFKDGVTDADKAKFGEKSGIVSALNDASNLKELKGWYAPFRRYGDFISSGEHELSVPTNATKISDNTVQFLDPKGDAASRRAAKAYAEQDAHTPQGNQLKTTDIKRVTVDKNDPSKLLDPTDPNSIVAYRATMQTQHTEFHDTEAEANRNKETLDEAGLTKTSVAKREDAHRSSPGMEGSLGSVIRSLEHNESYNKLDAGQRQAVKQSLMDASVRAMGSTNIKSSMAHRRNVAGMSRDLGRVTADYARMTANYLAGLRFGPKIAAAFAEMRKHMDANKYDGDRLKREEIYQELHDRSYGSAGALADRAPNPATRKLLQVSRLARLAGVSFHVINSMEPMTTSLPMIGGRHGFAQTTAAILKAYNTIGGMGAIRRGLSDTVKAFTNDHGFTDYVGLFKDNIAKSNTMGGAMSKFLMDTLDYANARNLWGNDAIFEVGQTADPSSNIAARALDRADRMANQVGAAVEGNNRAVTLLAAAELELKKNGGNQQAAMAYAYKMAVETMGDYSAWNASPVFNSGAGKMVLQFKKFAQKSYYMLGKSMIGTLKGDPESAKQFVGLMMTHALVAGALGVPGLEPFKVAMMISNAFGLSGYSPSDFENDVRTLAARVFGSKGGEMVSHGIFRGIGIEVSNRLGWDNLLTYGQPKSNKPNDIKAWLWDTMAGAPAGYLLDQVKTAQSLMKGDVAGAIATASPVRAVSDVAKAYSGAAGPKLSPTGVKQHAPLTPYQTGVRALGFTPAVTAEDGAMRGAVASDTKKLNDDRSGLVNAWVNAKPAGKASAWRDVQQWNRGQGKAAQIQMKDLTNAAARRTKAEKDGTMINGIRTTKRTKAIYDRASQTYNP